MGCFYILLTLPHLEARRILGLRSALTMMQLPRRLQQAHLTEQY